MTPGGVDVIFSLKRLSFKNIYECFTSSLVSFRYLHESVGSVISFLVNVIKCRINQSH